MSKKKIRNKQKTNTQKQELKKEIKQEKPILAKTKLEIYFERYGTIITLGLILLIGFFVFKDFLLFRKIAVFKDIGSDSLNLFYPKILNMSQYLSEEGYPMWSFSSGMGQNIFTNIINPLNFIYFFPKEQIPYVIIYLEFIKIILTGWIFYLYLKKLNVSQYVAICGALIFSFSGYMLIGVCWYIFSYSILLTVLGLYAFERLYQDKNYILFPFVGCFSGVENLYFFGIFIFIYALFRFIDDYGFKIKQLTFLYLKIFGLTLLGLAFIAPFLGSDILTIIDSARVSGDASLGTSLSQTPLFALENNPTMNQGVDYNHYITAFLRLFSNDLMGAGSDFKGWYNYLEAPAFYMGLITLLILPQIFIFLSKKQKILYGVFISFWILLVIFPYFRYAFYMFSGNYYRHALSLFIPFSFLFFAILAWHKIEKNNKINIKLLISTLVILLIFLSLDYSVSGISLVESTRLNFVRIFLIIYAGIFIALSRTQYRAIARFSILILLCIELIYTSQSSVNDRSVIHSRELEQKVGYNDYTVDAVKFIKENDSSFYRLNKEYASGNAIHGSMNDAMAQGFFGTPVYGSFNQKYYINFLHELGVINKANETQTRWCVGLRNRPLLMSLACVKYDLSKAQKPQMSSFGYTPVKKFGDVSLLKNEYYLPLGVTYDKFITIEEFRKLSQLQKDLMLLQAFIVDNGNAEKSFVIEKQETFYTQLQSKDSIPDFVRQPFGYYKNFTDSLKANHLKITYFTQSLIKGEIELEKPKMMFLAIPYDMGWKAEINGKEIDIKIINAGFLGLQLPKGKHKIKLWFSPPFLMQGIIVAIFAILCYISLMIIHIKKRKLKKEDIKNIK